jgi:glycosyltransferase 2 family protein
VNSDRNICACQSRCPTLPYHGYLEPPTTNPTPRTGRKNLGRNVAIAIALTISVVCLVIVLRDFHFDELVQGLKDANWWWIASAAVFDILVYVVQGWRWSLLLRPVTEVPTMRSIRAVYVGLFANEVLPLRSGEIIRCYLQSRWSNLPFSVTLSSALIERIFDGIWLISCLILATYMAPVDAGYVFAAQALGLFIGVAAALVGAAMFFKAETHAAFSKHRWLSKLSILLEDLNLIGHSRYLYFSALASLPYLLMQVLPIYALMRGYGLDLTLSQAFVVTIILRLATVLPAAPGNVGTIQLAAKAALMMYGVDRTVAATFSFVMFAVITLPLLIVGFIALAFTGLRLSELRRQAEQAH